MTAKCFPTARPAGIVTKLNKKAVIAMSGGVDSTAAAYLAQKQGYDCIGVTMKLFDNEDIGISRNRTCCSAEDAEDARSAAYKLGMPFYVLNFKGDFEDKVIKRFVSAYENGATPNPCIDCNRYLKFGALYSRARTLGCDAVVTGHYARIEKRGGRYLLKKASDKSKDQSYVLYSLTQEQLAHTLFPCGEFVKEEIRRMARELGFYNADKPDSQDICFVPDGDYASFIENYTGKKYPCGAFADREGNVLGRHCGIIRYTVGQRRGLGVYSDKPLYVCGIDSASDTVILGGADELMRRELEAEDFNWIAFERPSEKFRAKAKIRYSRMEQWADIFVKPSGGVRIVFDEPQRAITKGQSVVLYDGDIVIGGGVIVR